MMESLWLWNKYVKVSRRTLRTGLLSAHWKESHPSSCCSGVNEKTGLLTPSSGLKEEGHVFGNCTGFDIFAVFSNPVALNKMETCTKRLGFYFCRAFYFCSSAVFAYIAPAVLCKAVYLTYLTSTCICHKKERSQINIKRRASFSVQWINKTQ